MMSSHRLAASLRQTIFGASFSDSLFGYLTARRTGKRTLTFRLAARIYTVQQAETPRPNTAPASRGNRSGSCRPRLNTKWILRPKFHGEIVRPPPGPSTQYATSPTMISTSASSDKPAGSSAASACTTRSSCTTRNWHTTTASACSTTRSS